MSRTRRYLVAGACVAAVLAALAIRAAVVLAGAADDLRQAEQLVDQAATALEDGRLADARGALDQAQGLVFGANQSLRTSLVLDAAAMVPVAGQNIHSLRDSVAIAATVIHGGTRILGASAPLQSEAGTLEVSLSDGSIPLDAVAAARQEIATLFAQLVVVPRGDEPRFLAPQVRELRTAVHEEVGQRRQQLEVLGRGLTLLWELAGGDGPRRYLVAVANTAEMRGSGGMILNYGVLEGRAGTVELTAFGRIDELALGASVAADLVPEDYLARWDGFDPLLRWRQANLAGDFTLVAPALEAMFTAATRLPVNGVIQIDPAGLAALLDGVGPVQVPELGEVTGADVVDLTLHDAYVRFPGVEERTDVLGDVAEAAFTRLVEGEVPSLRTLAARLAEAVDGRHILVHATAGAVQRELVAFAADGALPPVDAGDSFALTAQNLTGTKLDYFLDTDLELRGERPPDDVGTVEATVTLANAAAPGATEPRYVYGPGFAPGAPPAGVQRTLVTLYLPLGTSVEEVSGADTREPVVTGTEAGRPYASFVVDVPPGQARSVELSLRLGPRRPGPYELVLVPSPRVRPTTVRVDLATEAGPVRGEVELDRRWVVAPGAAPAPVAAPAFR